LYFTGVIPPVPLALRDIGIYHILVREEQGLYRGVYEPAPWWQVWKNTSTTYTATSGEGATCFSSVFAPTGLDTPIRHRWEKYDDAVKKWTTTALVSFPITGGRAEGYRGFSTKSALSEGKWRCVVETDRGQRVGQFTFIVRWASVTPLNIETRDM